MALFKATDPDLQAQKDCESSLRSRRRDRASLTERLAISETAITTYRAQARQLASEGADDKTIAVAETRMRESADRCDTLRGAVVDVDKIIAGIEAQIDQIVDKRCRRETSAAVDAMASRLAAAQAAHQAAALELEEAAKEGGILIPESVAVHQFVLSMREQLIPANEMIVDALKQHARGILAGHGSPSLPRPAPAPPVLTVVAPPPEPTMNIFAIRNLKYVNATGGITKVGKYKRADLPKKLAELALSSGVALPISDKRMRDLEQMASPLQPDETSCEWIGPPGKEAPPVFMRPGGEPVAHSAFEPHPNVREPFTVMVPRGPEPVAVGQRSEGDDQ
jgi:hypothetical protein